MSQKKQLTIEEIQKALTKVIDPELAIDIVNLGLIRSIDLGEWFDELGVHEYIKVTMTLTSPMCPFADMLMEEVETTLMQLQAGEVQLELTFDPPWEPSEELKLQLGL